MRALHMLSHLREFDIQQAMAMSTPNREILRRQILTHGLGCFL